MHLIRASQFLRLNVSCPAGTLRGALTGQPPPSCGSSLAAQLTIPDALPAHYAIQRSDSKYSQVTNSSIVATHHQLPSIFL
jgi:hypothetical protein